MSKLFAIKDKRVNEVVSVARPNTTKESIAWKINKWNRKVENSLGDTSNPYELTTVKEGTKATTSYQKRPENLEGNEKSKVAKKKKTAKKPAKKKKVIEKDNTLRPIKEYTGPIRCPQGHLTENPAGKKCECWIGSKIHDGVMKKILCSETKRK